MTLYTHTALCVSERTRISSTQPGRSIARGSRQWAQHICPKAIAILQHEHALKVYDEPFSSGGGFSNIYPVPKYQKAATKTYFADHDPGYKFYKADSCLRPKDVYKKPRAGVAKLAASTGGIYNRIGRGIPDVGHHFRKLRGLID